MPSEGVGTPLSSVRPRVPPKSCTLRSVTPKAGLQLATLKLRPIVRLVTSNDPPTVTDRLDGPWPGASGGSVRYPVPDSESLFCVPRASLRSTRLRYRALLLALKTVRPLVVAPRSRPRSTVNPEVDSVASACSEV